MSDHDDLCCNGTCRRRQPVLVMLSDLTGRAYAVTRWRRSGSGVVADEKHDVTNHVRRLMAEAWARGWQDYANATPGDVVDNPYEETA